jgi:hypothetical protein
MNNFCVDMRPLLRAFFLLFFLSGCSTVRQLFSGEPKIVLNKEIKRDTPKDYADHLAALKKSLINNPEVNSMRLTSRNRRYLTEIFRRIQSNNELLLPKGDPSFYIIRDKTPFIFSLPNYQFFISRGLIKKYFKNESLLISAFTFQVVKSGRKIYPKAMVFPVGQLSIPEVLSITRIPLKSKMEIYKWTFFALRRSELDGTAILNWIQTQNKNTLDFSWQIRDPRGVSREEYLFKNFLVTQGIDQIELPEINSSKGFYKFQDTI